MRIAVLNALVAPVSLSVIFCGTAIADVLDAEVGGFTTVNETTIDASRDVVWQAAVTEIDQWWSSDHTVSGKASRLRIDAKPQGCFCEYLGEGAGVVHMTVTMLNPSVLLRLTGGLGPLGLMGVDGNMTWEFSDADDGTRVKFTYAVGGYRPGGLDSIASPVDGVIGEALLRLKAHVETGDAEQSNIE
ncbi:MAG: ATPase [Gammaproteobacteria bacterium]|nr:ATPase [Gammaproteobacteria bacterium]